MPQKTLQERIRHAKSEGVAPAIKDSDLGRETDVILSDKKRDRSGLHRERPILFQVVPCTKPCEDEEDTDATQQKRSPPPRRGGVPIGPVPGR